VNLTPRIVLDVDSTERGKLSSKSFLSLDSAVSSPISHGFRGSGAEQMLCFASAAELLEHVTRNWRRDFVTQDLRTEQAIQTFTKRPFFMLISIDGPISDRFRRANKFVLYPLYHLLHHARLR
jgi:dCMP deaminase